MTCAADCKKVPLLEFQNLDYPVAERDFFQQLNFSITAGGLIGLMGSNGAGKTTLLKLAAGLLQPKRGRVLLGGKDISSYSGRKRAQYLAYLPQLLDMNAPFRVAELVSMGSYFSQGQQHFSITEAIEIVGLSGKADAFLSDLSGGERRRAYIAMTLLQGGKLLLLDEPLANLDLKYQLELLRLLKQICRDKQISVIISFHDIALASRMDRLMMLKNGKLVADGKPEKLMNNDIIREVFDLADEDTTQCFFPNP